MKKKITIVAGSRMLTLAIAYKRKDFEKEYRNEREYD
jgi:hypothetical protein